MANLGQVFFSYTEQIKFILSVKCLPANDLHEASSLINLCMLGNCPLIFFLYENIYCEAFARLYVGKM